ncbi:MAG TPA: DHA2 family efflux MFS transporter permease subunit [Candidatus Binataceae bacterium]|nr:DHA2 family efflux MFS transporter permease subunit [Candidatus Binataceae bacterium]
MAAAPDQASTTVETKAASSNKWLIAVAVMLATVMEVLDTTIANVSLLHIRGSLSADVDEAAWVLTSYIVATGIVIPLTGWCSAYFGRKRFFSFCILLFVGSSLAAGASPNLHILVLFRVLQGFGGGAMMPLSQAILMETFPPEEQATAMAVWGLGMMLAPVMGPTLGGWITDNYSWRWIFYINVPTGLMAFVMVAIFVHDPEYIRRGIKRIDWWGLSYLVLGIATLQIMLDRGDRLDWFNSNVIIWLTIIGVIALILFTIRELHTKEPIVDLHVLNNRDFAVGTVITTIVMFAMYSTFVLIPLFCQQISGYTPILAGEVLSIQSIGTFLSIMAAGRLFNKLDPRFLVALGCLAAGTGTTYMANFYAQIDFWNIALPGLLRGIGSGLIFIPLTTLSLSAVPKEQMGNASGLFNMVRTVGGSVGIAILVAMLSINSQVHQNYLAGHVDPFRLSAMAHMNGIAALGASTTQQGSTPFVGMIYGEVQRQASVLSFLDDFRMLSWIFFIIAPAVLFIRRPKSPAAAAAAH